MKLLLLALLFTAPAAYAQEVKVATQPAAPAQETRYAPEILETMKNLSILLERGAEVKPAKLDTLAAEMKKFNGRVKDTLGEEILAVAAAKEKELENRARTAAAKRTLQDLRVKLQAYYAGKGGVYPADLTALAGGIPELYLPGHQQTAAVKVMDSKQYDKDFSKAVEDSGGWLYFSAPGSANYGMLLLDCSHKDDGAVEFYKY